MRYVKVVAAGFMFFGLVGCQPVASHVMGALFLDVKGPISATTATGMREGTACAKTILGLVGTGDASIDAAKKAGGIQEVSSVDYHATNTLGIVAEFCTIVHGSGEVATAPAAPALSPTPETHPAPKKRRTSP
jgi:hypothetical protein